jgi:ElaB/YqjD/DUF883 family membrane-anchored ribosome-binding protein
METTTTSPVGATDPSTRDRLAHSLQQVVEEAEHLLKNAQRTGSEQFNAARDRFESQLRSAKAELNQLERAALDNAKRAAHATDQAVHQHPYTAMGVAAGIGLLIGMLVARR